MTTVFLGLGTDNISCGRGMFRSNEGKLINADVNAAYQIMKAGGCKDIPVKENEKVIRMNVA